MLRIDISRLTFSTVLGGPDMQPIASIDIVNTGDHPDRPEFGNYRWTIEQDGGEVDGIAVQNVVKGTLENHKRSDGPLWLALKVLAMWGLSDQNVQITDGWVRSLLTIEASEANASG